MKADESGVKIKGSLVVRVIRAKPTFRLRVTDALAAMIRRTS